MSWGEITLDLGKDIGFKCGLAIWEGEFARKVIFGESYGVEFVHEVVDQPWRQLTVRFLDPDGHMIEVGERIDVCIWRLKKSGESAESRRLPRCHWRLLIRYFKIRNKKYLDRGDLCEEFIRHFFLLSFDPGWQNFLDPGLSEEIGPCHYHSNRER